MIRPLILLIWSITAGCCTTALAQSTFTKISQAPAANNPTEPSDLTIVNNRILYESAASPTEDKLMSSDGTAAGTVEIMRYEPYVSHGTGISFYPFSRVSNRILFARQTPTTLGLWATDGTPQGTEQLTAVSSVYYNASYFFTRNNKLYFINESNAGVHLIETDGTNAGTAIIKTFCTGGADCFVQTAFEAFKIADKGVFFIGTPSTGQEPWITDGTAAGTRCLEIVPGAASSTSRPYVNGVTMNGKLYFGADGGTGEELFVTDGLTTPTKLLEINPTVGNNVHNVHAAPNSFFTYNNKTYFMADNYTNGQEMWVTDGTAAGTMMLKDIAPGRTESGTIPHFYVVNNKVLYQLSSTDYQQPNKCDIYSTDSTPAGTSKITNWNYVFDAFVPRIVYNNKLYFIATHTTGTHLYMTDGTAAGTTLVKTLNTSAQNQDLAVANSAKFQLIGTKFYFLCLPTGSTVAQLWESDGTGAGTKAVTLQAPVVVAAANDVRIYELVQLNNAVFYSANYNTTTNELWRFAPTLPVGFDNPLLSNATFTVYPNPSTGEFCLSANSDFAATADYTTPLSIQITSLTGQNIQTIKTVNLPYTLNLAALPNGIYFAKIQTSTGKLFTQKLLVQK